MKQNIRGMLTCSDEEKKKLGRKCEVLIVVGKIFRRVYRRGDGGSHVRFVPVFLVKL